MLIDVSDGGLIVQLKSSKKYECVHIYKELILM